MSGLACGALQLLGRCMGAGPELARLHVQLDGEWATLAAVNPRQVLVHRVPCALPAGTWEIPGNPLPRAGDPPYLMADLEPLLRDYRGGFPLWERLVPEPGPVVEGFRLGAADLDLIAAVVGWIEELRRPPLEYRATATLAAAGRHKPGLVLFSEGPGHCDDWLLVIMGAECA